MLKFSNWQIVLIIGTVLFGALLAVPNFLTDEQVENLPGFMPKSQINLGLDLQGGTYLLLGVETDDVVTNRLTNMRRSITREMRPSGGNKRVALRALPSVKLEDRSIVFSVRNDVDVDEAERRVREITRAPIGAGFGAAPPYEVSKAGAQITIKMTPTAERTFKAAALADSIEVVRRRIDPAGNKEVSIQPQGESRIIVQAPGIDPEVLKEALEGEGKLTFHHVDQSVPTADAEAGLLPPGRILVEMAASEGGGFLVLDEDPVITGDMVESADAGVDAQGGGFQINFRFDGRGARAFADYTANNIHQQFAINLDNEVISAPTIQSSIPSGQGRITGRFTAAEASRIATLIRAGALPAPLQIIEQRSVDAELGKESIEAGRLALIIGFVGVIIYMVLSYGRFGLYADVALIANIILIAGALSLFGSTLTLPGIAGVVLTIGMAVDANVLIFERVREEMLGGKSPVNALQLGFEKARSAILDANVTTFGAAFIMFFLGAGPVRGFAITLMIGVVTSVFTAYFLTRLLAGRWVLSARPKEMKL